MEKVPKKQILTLIERENLWWNEPFDIPNNIKNFQPRPYLDLFFPLVENTSVRRAVVLMGPRRVGKTVLIHHAIDKLLTKGIVPRQIAYFSVDHPLYNGLSLEDLLELFKDVSKTDYLNIPTYIFFDEIQYLRDWEVHLKSLVDRYPHVKAIVSGSAAAALRLMSLESGAGRFTDFLLPPLTFHEYLTLLGKSDLIVPELADEDSNIFIASDIVELNNAFLNYLNYGGYPEVVFSAAIQRDPGRFIKADIIDKVLLRDLPSLYGIQDIQELNYLFTTLAFNTANEISLEELSKDSGVAKNTIKRYIEYLEAAFLIRTVHRVDQNGRRFKRANFFKVYLSNPSLRCALFAPIQADDPEISRLVETAIFSQWFHQEDRNLFYGRWKKGEVDIVYLGQENKIYWAVEAKWSDRFVRNPGELKSSLAFCHSNNLSTILVTTRTERANKIYKNVVFEFVPASEYCYTVGFNIIKGKKIDQSTIPPIKSLPD